MASFLSRLMGDRTTAPAAPDAKASRAAALIAHMSMGFARWTPRNYVELTRQGYERNPIVYRSVRMIAEAAASIAWRAYSGREEIPDHPILSLLARPNPGDVGPTFFEALYSNLMLFGNAYVEAGLLNGAPRELYVLRSDRMAVVPGPNGWPAAYDYMVAGENVRYDMTGRGVQPILQLKLFHPLDDHYGFAPMGAAQTPVDVHNAASGWTKALLDNSARPSGALVYAGPQGSTLSDEQFERLKAELEESFSGPRNAGRPLLLEGGLDWKALSLTPKDMDFIEAKAGAAREIALAFGVPPMMLGIPGDNTFSNYQEANRAFWRQTVIPLVARTQKSFGAWLQPAFGDVKLDYDVDRIDALADERATEWARIDAANFLTIDEKREAVGYGKAPENAVTAMPKTAKKKPPVEMRYAPGQPRVPAGNGRVSGRWGDGGAGGVKPATVAPAANNSAPVDPPAPKPIRLALDETTTNLTSDAGPEASVIPAMARVPAPSAEDALAQTQEARAKIAANAQSNVGSEKWSDDVANGNYPNPSNKCNLFVYDMTTAAGASPGLPNGMLHGYPPLAEQWADPNYSIPGWTVLGPGRAPQAGDVVAQKIAYGDASGHVMIVGSNNTVIGTGTGNPDDTHGLIVWKAMPENLGPANLVRGPLVFRRWSPQP